MNRLHDLCSVVAWRGGCRLAVVSLWAGLVLCLPAAWAGDDQDDRHLATTTATYPPQKAVYNELRALKDLQVGDIAPPPSVATAPRLHVIGTQTRDTLRVDGTAGGPSALLIDGHGRVGIHTDAPDVGARLDVHGATAIVGGDVHLGVHKSGSTVTRDPPGDTSDHFVCEGCIQAADVDSATVQVRTQDDASHCGPGYAVKEIHQDGGVVCIQIQRRTQ